MCPLLHYGCWRLGPQDIRNLGMHSSDHYDHLCAACRRGSHDIINLHIMQVVLITGRINPSGPLRNHAASDKLLVIETVPIDTRVTRLDDAERNDGCKWHKSGASCNPTAVS